MYRLVSQGTSRIHYIDGPRTNNLLEQQHSFSEIEPLRILSYHHHQLSATPIITIRYTSVDQNCQQLTGTRNFALQSVRGGRIRYNVDVRQKKAIFPISH